MAFVFYLEVSWDHFIYACVENPSILGFYITMMEIIKDKNIIEFTRFVRGQKTSCINSKSAQLFP